MIVEKANSVMLTATRYCPAGPIRDSNAAIVRDTPLSGAPLASTPPSTPEAAITSPVIVQTTIVSKNVPVMLIYPCCTQSSVDAAAAEIAAEPMPASLEKHPRANP